MNSDHSTVLATFAFKSNGRLKPWQLRIAKRKMLDHMETGVSVTELAEACGLSRSHFTRIFKESTGTAPQQWMRKQRISKSKHLLETSTMLLAEIALECGFCDQSHFCRTFRTAEGMTPHAWQQHAWSQRMHRTIQLQRNSASGSRSERRIVVCAGSASLPF
ncbi:AraC family transcriptional regulator [Pseudomonas sp. s4]|uniref:AraC family transcriptional regulator n=1 Tax=Pseudomonas sp. s4 TaxID=353218 RepID=UPI00398D4A3F